MKFRLVLERAGEILRQEGVRGLWFKILGDTVYRRLLLLERPLHEPSGEVKAGIPVEISLLQKSEIAEYVEFRQEGKDTEVEAQLEAGDWCFVARHQGHIVCARWATTGPVWSDYLSCELRLAADEIYIYDVFTKPGLRGQAVSPATSTEMLRYFRAAGYRRLVTAILPENQPSLRAVAKTGHRPYGLIGYITIGPWKRYFYREKHAPT
jgi:RimJ/RimL family protein N-acetyltransferase